MLGLARISERTLVRWAGQCRRFGIAGCIDGQLAAPRRRRPSITEQVREAIYAVHAECLHRSRVSMTTRERLIRQYVRERFGPEVADPLLLDPAAGSGPNGSALAVPGSVTPGRRRSCRSPASMW